ncbi:MAG: hypothetical protein ACE5OZ_23245 [Candidatus Heimdallarchaeota archaeon]
MKQTKRDTIPKKWQLIFQGERWSLFRADALNYILIKNANLQQKTPAQAIVGYYNSLLWGIRNLIAKEYPQEIGFPEPKRKQELIGRVAQIQQDCKQLATRLGQCYQSISSENSFRELQKYTLFYRSPLLVCVKVDHLNVSLLPRDYWDKHQYHRDRKCLGYFMNPRMAAGEIIKLEFEYRADQQVAQVHGSPIDDLIMSFRTLAKDLFDEIRNCVCEPWASHPVVNVQGTGKFPIQLGETQEVLVSSITPTED